MAKDGILQIKSEAFSVRIVNLRKYLQSKFKERELSSQIVRSGTSIGANIAEAFAAQSKADFIAKLYISLKESSETSHWLRVLHKTDYLTDKEFNSIYKDCNELRYLLIHSIKKSKMTLSENK